jgi:predicted transcriptional regulator of viral defense system
MNRVAALRAMEEVAAEQAGLITSAQAAVCGVDRMTQRRLTDAGMLENVGRGVYRMVGAPPPSHLELRVAWLRLDPATPAWRRNGRGRDDGVISHRSATILYDLGDVPAPQIELTVPRRRTTREPGVRLQVGRLEQADVSFIDGLPVTTVERTIVDLLRNRADGAHVGSVIAEAERRGMVEMTSLARSASGLGGRYGLPRAAGGELIAHLVAQAGQRLSTTDVQRAMLAGFLAAQSFTVR